MLTPSAQNPDFTTLAVRNPTNGVTDSFTLSEGGGTAYLRWARLRRRIRVTVRSGGATPPATVRMTVIRRK